LASDAATAAAHTPPSTHQQAVAGGPYGYGADAGNVCTQRATGGSSPGTISAPTTAEAVTGPGSPVRRRATQAMAKPSSTFPASARPTSGQDGRVSRSANASTSPAPTPSGTSRARTAVRRPG